MKEGTLELMLLGIVFLTLQVWWISLTIKNGKQNQNEIDIMKESLAAKKKSLENLLKK